MASYVEILSDMAAVAAEYDDVKLFHAAARIALHAASFGRVRRPGAPKYAPHLIGFKDTTSSAKDSRRTDV